MKTAIDTYPKCNYRYYHLDYLHIMGCDVKLLPLWSACLAWGLLGKSALLISVLIHITTFENLLWIQSRKSLFSTYSDYESNKCAINDIWGCCHLTENSKVILYLGLGGRLAKATLNFSFFPNFLEVKLT